MSDAAEPPDAFDDTVVLSNEPPPVPPGRGDARASEPRRRLALVLAVILVAVVAWVNRPRSAPPIVSDSATERGSRTTPIYPGALGRLLFTVPENATASSIDAERVWIVSLDNGAVEKGPLLPPVGTEFGIPPGPGLPPDRRFALGPAGTPSAKYLAFLGDAPQEFPTGTVVYLLDVGSGRMPALPVALAQADDFAWDPRDGSLLTVRRVGAEVLVERLTPGVPATVIARKREPGTIGGSFHLILSGPSIYVLSPADRLEVVRGGTLRTVLESWQMVVAGPNGHIVVRRVQPETERLSEWRGQGPPTRLEGFLPDQILGQTPDRLRYAATGTFRGSYGVWLVEFPNLPVFELAKLEQSGGGVGNVTFDPDVRAALFAFDFELRAVQIGSEESVTIPLTGSVAHQTPSGPVVWIP